MLFNDIASKLLSLKNCSILIDGAFFVQDMHVFTKSIMKRVSEIKNPATSEEAKLLKKQLENILLNYEKGRKMLPKSNRPRK
jgi:hypothetical protein